MTAGAKTLVGSVEPRLWTRPARSLGPRTSLGFECIKFAEEVLGLRLFDWQRWFLQHALEINPDRTFRFRTVCLIVSRQAGKSTIVRVLSLFGAYCLNLPMTLSTAQSLDSAEESWEAAVDWAESIPDLACEIDRVVRVNGKKNLQLRSGARLKVTAATRRAGRGFSADLVVLDELREHQNWEAWGALTKTTIARPNSLLVALSSAGDDSSVVLRHLRMSALKKMAADGDPEAWAELERWAKVVHYETPESEDETEVGDFDDDDDSHAHFEWSAAPGANPQDRTAWAMANPSLNVGISERALAASQKVDPPWIFAQECLGIWTSSSGNGPFPAGSWTAGTDNKSEIALNSPIAACVELSWDRLMAHVAVAGFRPDGDIHCELIQSRAGVDWLMPYLLDRHARHRFSSITCQEKGAPISSLVPSLMASDLPYVAWGGSELGRGTGNFYDLVRLPGPGETKKRVYHTRQPVIDIPGTSARVKNLGEATVIDRRNSPGDASPLVALIGAVWALQHEAPSRPKTSAYESRRLVMV